MRHLHLQEPNLTGRLSPGQPVRRGSKALASSGVGGVGFFTHLPPPLRPLALGIMFQMDIALLIGNPQTLYVHASTAAFLKYNSCCYLTSAHRQCRWQHDARGSVGPPMNAGEEERNEGEGWRREQTAVSLWNINVHMVLSWLGHHKVETGCCNNETGYLYK